LSESEDTLGAPAPAPHPAKSNSPKPVVSIGFINGLNFATAVPEIFGSLADEFSLVESARPRLCISGPYGTDTPPAGSTHIGYLCENIRPEPTAYDWCFGTWEEEEVGHPRYTRITWHGFDPRTLIKTPAQIASWLQRPRRFCNFFYSNRVAHREDFCRALSRYQSVDCPGRSLRNMPPIDQGQSDAGKWSRKRDFLTGYRFTIAFENSSAPGYHTEKILDPMVAGSIPIYWGDPDIASHFNPRSFVNVRDLLPPPSERFDRWLRRRGGRTHRDYCPAQYSRPVDRIVRRAHRLTQQTADFLWRLRGWQPLVNAIRDIDTDGKRYAAMLSEPWFKGNRPPPDPMREQWRLLLTACAVS
jgi:hypothetical protein